MAHKKDSATPGSKQRHQRLLMALSIALALLLAACGGTPPGPTPQPPATEEFTVAILTEGLTLTAINESRQLGATVLDKAGRELTEATVSWISSNPEAVRVSADGIVTALADVGYATIRAEYRGFSSKHVPVAVVKLTPGSRILEDDEVISASEGGTEAVLALNDTTRSLNVGDIIVNSKVFGRITQLDRNPQGIRVRTQMLSLPEMFDDIDFMLSTKPITMKITLSADGIDVQSDTLTESQLSTLAAAPAIVCDAGATFQFTDIVIDELGVVEWDVEYNPSLEYSYSQNTGPNMRVTHSQSTVVSRSSDVITLNQNITFAGSCYIKFPLVHIPLGMPLPGVVFSLDVTPKVGFEISAKTTNPVTITGPALTGHSVSFEGGIDFSNGEWSPFGTVNDFSPGTITPTDTLQGSVEKIQSAIGPFVAASLSLGIGVPIIVDIVNVEFYKPKAYLALKHKIEVPIDFNELAYAGPSWKLVGGVKTWAGLKLQGLVGTAFGYMGIHIGLTAVELTLFEESLFESPQPAVDTVDTASLISVQNAGKQYLKELRVDINSPESKIISPVLYQGWSVLFLGTRAGESSSEVIASATLNSTGQATATWNTLNSPPDDYTIRALIHPLSEEGWIPNLSFPYASKKGLELTVDEPLVSLAITKAEPSSAAIGTKLEFEAEYHYPFPVTGLRLQWVVNDQVFKSENLTRFDGSSSLTICARHPEMRVEARIYRNDSSLPESERVVISDTATIPVENALDVLAYAEIVSNNSLQSRIISYLIDSDPPPLVATVRTPGCVDTDNTHHGDPFWYDFTGILLAEAKQLKPELLRDPRTGIFQPRTFIAVFDVAGSELRTQVTVFPCEDSGVLTSRGGRYGPCVTPMPTDVLEATFDRLGNLDSQAAALDAVNLLLTASLRSHGVSPGAIEVPRARVISTLSNSYSREFMAYLGTLFRAVDASSPEAATEVLLAGLQSLSSGGWKEVEAQQLMNTTALLIATIDRFSEHSEGGREDWRRLPFDPGRNSRAGQVDRLEPARAALEAYLAVLATNPGLKSEASFEIAQQVAARTAVTSVGRSMP